VQRIKRFTFESLALEFLREDGGTRLPMVLVIGLIRTVYSRRHRGLSERSPMEIDAVLVVLHPAA
jgi:hypothetical protein